MQRTDAPRSHLPLAGSVFLLATAILAGCLGNLGEQSGTWEVSFDPALDLRKCDASQANLTIQAIAPDPNGEVSALWPSVSSTGPVSVNLQLNDTAFFGNLKCVSSGANGILSGSFNGAGYTGTYRFSGQSGNVSITRSQDCRGDGCNNDCGPSGCNNGCQGPGCNNDCGNQGCYDCQGPNCGNNPCGNQECYECQGPNCGNDPCGNQGCNDCQGPNCNNNCGSNGCSTQTCGPNTCGEDFSGIWHVSFQPMIDVSVCVGTNRKWSDQNLVVQSNGNFDNVWAPQQEANTLRVFGQLTRGDFHATLECARANPNGTPRGEMNGPRGQSRYEGVYTFYDSWPPGNVYIARPGAAPTSSSPATSTAPTSPTASPTSASPSTTSSPAPTTASSPPPHVPGWTSKASMPSGRTGAAGAAVDGLLYVVGGANDGGMHAYDPQANTWTAREPFPGAYRAYAGATPLNGLLYVVGGCESQPGTGPDCRIGTTGAMMSYDPATGSWTARAAMPTPRFYTATATISGKIYVAGGLGACPPCPASAALELYDPGTDSWSVGPPMPTARANPYFGVIGGKLYVAGGSNGTTVHTSIDIYDPATQSWSAGPAMPAAYQLGTSGVIGGRLHIVAGQDAAGANVRDVLSFDPATGAWTNLAPIPTGRYAPASGVIGLTLYVAGGGPNNSLIPTLEAFNQ